MSLLSPFTRFILSWVLLIFIIAIALIPVLNAYESYNKAEIFYQQVEALGYGGIFNPFEVDRQRSNVKQEYNKLLFYLIYHSLVAAIVLLIAAIKLTSFNRFKRKYARQLERSRAKPLYICVEELAKDIGLGYRQITLWFENTTQIAPSCTTRGDDIHIICPSGFINLFTSDRVSAKAMLAHELGHVLQKDSSLWRVVGAARSCVVFFIALKVLEISFFILAVLFLIPSSSRNPINDDWMLSVIVYAIYIAVQVGACKFITDSKLQSELGADIYASIVVPADTVIDAVKKYLSNSASIEVFFRSHPTLSERVKNIETYLSQNNEAMPEVDEGKTDTNYFFWALRQLYLIYFRPSQFHREVEGPKKNQPKLTQAQRYVYVIKMLPWIILLAHINNLIIGSFWDITGIGYRWDLSWIAVEIGVAVGLFIGFGMTENDISVSVISGITYGYLAGTFFNLIVLFHFFDFHSFVFMAAFFGLLAGSLMGILGDSIDKDDSGKNDPVESLGQSIFIGISGGVMLGVYPAIASAVMAGLAFIFTGDFWNILKLFGQSYLAFGITFCLVFYLVHLRLLAYPVELFISFLSYLKAKTSRQDIIKAWRLHPFSWSETSKLPLPFAKSLLTNLAMQDRNEGARQIAFIISARKFHARVALRVLEATIIHDLQAETVKEIANITNKLSWVKDIPAKTSEYLVSVLPQFDQASQHTARYLAENGEANAKDLRDALQTLKDLQINVHHSRKRVASQLAYIAKRWLRILTIEETQILERIKNKILE